MGVSGKRERRGWRGEESGEAEGRGREARGGGAGGVNSQNLNTKIGRWTGLAVVPCLYFYIQCMKNIMRCSSK